MKKLMFSVAVACSFSAFANAAPETTEVAPLMMAPMAIEPIAESFAKLGIIVNSVEGSPIPGLKTVLTNKGVLYASPDGKYLMQGNMINLETRTNVTENALSGVRKEGVSQYQDSMIVYKAENEKHQITVFTDITCGYCRKLHRELDDYLSAGITVKYLAYPRGGLRGSGYEDLRNVWCAKDAAQALTDAKAGQDVAKVENCSAPVAEHYQLGQSFGLSGTPAIILDDGTLIPGYQPAAELSKMLNAEGKKS
ncbi:Thiol:disulfide interchange protein DsbC [Pseudoalteromonas holothuriae]|uniref:Thiol:disulfide interchange protein n=1 Tax=Pseudoalteromonas holothuriae TaxID=2963714 RepID=A0A9W4QQX0_9GAMM|nr:MULTISPECIES: bifunctional protein-disulfide isomerase/oxidoreductase DsbC [unclassified Pseudoalteromonas]CAH9049560.1 Thiol:disulfide interchange protein DsbC [Pseudoalteromonas sp. CIP111854]CAH9067358.1 Thiol:disulfide interchange protein DsbC [Pseudoalteromonas sp. CIP111951]